MPSAAVKLSCSGLSATIWGVWVVCWKHGDSFFLVKVFCDCCFIDLLVVGEKREWVISEVSFLPMLGFSQVFGGSFFFFLFFRFFFTISSPEDTPEDRDSGSEMYSMPSSWASLRRCSLRRSRSPFRYF
jgi:hypothetical protein